VRVPVFLDLGGRRVVVVGAGTVGLRRATALAAAGADVTVIDPTPVDPVPAPLTHLPRPYAPADIRGAWLVLACTDDPEANDRIAGDAEAQGVWCGRADDADSSALWMPAVARVDDVTVAVSAGGDPGRARSLRDAVARSLHSGDLHARPTRDGGGRVVLVGGGPGDPGLITVRGYRALLDADVVVTDRLGPVELAHRLPAGVEVVDVGKDPRGHAASQSDINELLVRRASAGERVVRLKGGDPFVLGRGAEEVAACVAAGVAVEVIPGVSSVTSAPTLAGIPLTRRGTTQAFTVVSGHVPPGHPASTVDWAALAQAGGTLLILMAVTHLRAIAEAIVTGGRTGDTPAAVVENASLPQMRVVRGTLSDIADVADSEQVVPPAVVVVGEVVSDLPDGAGARP
jgi:uroporphyrin-III C-methyltransferase / precorrin-2 dehydrogenase / sirohydrochlorin ferrochelatase